MRGYVKGIAHKEAPGTFNIFQEQGTAVRSISPDVIDRGQQEFCDCMGHCRAVDGNLFEPGKFIPNKPLVVFPYLG